ncbi:hypothetical protein V8E36_005545 [Tilletia maclaganii]
MGLGQEQDRAIQEVHHHNQLEGTTRCKSKPNSPRSLAPSLVVFTSSHTLRSSQDDSQFKTGSVLHSFRFSKPHQGLILGRDMKLTVSGCNMVNLLRESRARVNASHSSTRVMSAPFGSESASQGTRARDTFDLVRRLGDVVLKKQAVKRDEVTEQVEAIEGGLREALQRGQAAGRGAPQRAHPDDVRSHCRPSCANAESSGSSASSHAISPSAVAIDFDRTTLPRPRPRSSRRVVPTRRSWSQTARPQTPSWTSTPRSSSSVPKLYALKTQSS